MLNIKSNNGTFYLVYIEAKYRSGKSSQAEIPEETEEQIEIQFERECKDQLTKEWKTLLREAKILQFEPVLVFLTADVSCPKEEIEESVQDFVRNSPSNSGKPIICWLSWRELPGLFRKNADPHLADLAKMAEERMCLIYFQGISSIVHLLQLDFSRVTTYLAFSDPSAFVSMEFRESFTELMFSNRLI